MKKTNSQNETQNEEETPDFEVFKALSVFRDRPDKVLVLKTFPGMTKLYKQFHRTSWVPDKASKPMKMKEAIDVFGEEIKEALIPRVGGWRWVSGPYTQQEVRFDHDGIEGVDYFLFHSRATRGFEKIEALLRKKPMEFYSEKEILEQFHAAREDDERYHAFWALMLIQEELASPEALEVAKRMLASPNASVRLDVVKVISKLRWREARLLIEPLRKDPDKEVRAAAKIAVGDLSRIESLREN